MKTDEPEVAELMDPRSAVEEKADVVGRIIALQLFGSTCSWVRKVISG